MLHTPFSKLEVIKWLHAWLKYNAKHLCHTTMVYFINRSIFLGPKVLTAMILFCSITLVFVILKQVCSMLNLQKIFSLFFFFFSVPSKQGFAKYVEGVLIWCNKRQRGGWRLQSSKQKKDRLRVWTNYVPLVFRWRMQCSPLMKWRKDFGRKLFSFLSC